MGWSLDQNTSQDISRLSYQSCPKTVTAMAKMIPLYIPFTQKDSGLLPARSDGHASAECSPLWNSLHLLLQKNWSDSGKCLRSSRCWKPLSMTSCFDFMPKCKHQHSTRFNTMQLWFKTYNTFSHRNIEDSPIWVCVKISGWGNPSILGPHLETEPMYFIYNHYANASQM